MESIEYNYHCNNLHLVYIDNKEISLFFHSLIYWLISLFLFLCNLHIISPYLIYYLFWIILYLIHRLYHIFLVFVLLFLTQLSSFLFHFRLFFHLYNWYNFLLF